MLSRCLILSLLQLTLTHLGHALQPDEPNQDMVSDVFQRLLEINNKRNMEAESPFFAIRGKKSYWVDEEMKPIYLVGSIQEKRSIKPNSLFGSYNKRSLRPNSLFGIVTTKRSLKPNSLFGTYGKRVLKPNGFFGPYNKKSTQFKPNGLFNVGKKNHVKPNGLFMVGKKSFKPNGLFSVGKKNSLKPNGLFYAGKKNMLKPNGLFSMSKKHVLPLHLISEYQEEDEDDYSEEDVDEPFYVDLEMIDDETEMNNDEEATVEKRGDSDFWAARGKRDQADDSDFWATRGKRGHDGHDSDFWAARGKRGESISSEAVNEEVVEAQEPKDI